MARYRSERAKPFMHPEAVRRRAEWWAWQATDRRLPAPCYCEPYQLTKMTVAAGYRWSGGTGGDAG